MSTTTHTLWCNPTDCIQSGFPSDPTHHRDVFNRFEFGDLSGWFEVNQCCGEAIKLGVLLDSGGGDMTLPQVDEFIKALTAARERLAQVH